MRHSGWLVWLLASCSGVVLGCAGEAEEGGQGAAVGGAAGNGAAGAGGGVADAAVGADAVGADAVGADGSDAAAGTTGAGGTLGDSGTARDAAAGDAGVAYGDSPCVQCVVDVCKVEFTQCMTDPQCTAWTSCCFACAPESPSEPDQACALACGQPTSAASLALAWCGNHQLTEPTSTCAGICDIGSDGG